MDIALWETWVRPLVICEKDLCVHSRAHEYILKSGDLGRDPRKSAKDGSIDRDDPFLFGKEDHINSTPRAATFVPGFSLSVLIQRLFSYEFVMMGGASSVPDTISSWRLCSLSRSLMFTTLLVLFVSTSVRAQFQALSNTTSLSSSSSSNDSYSLDDGSISNAFNPSLTCVDPLPMSSTSKRPETSQCGDALVKFPWNADVRQFGPGANPRGMFALPKQFASGRCQFTVKLVPGGERSEVTSWMWLRMDAALMMNACNAASHNAPFPFRTGGTVTTGPNSGIVISIEKLPKSAGINDDGDDDDGEGEGGGSSVGVVPVGVHGNSSATS